MHFSKTIALKLVVLFLMVASLVEAVVEGKKNSPTFSSKLVLEKIRDERDYLLRQENPRWHAFFKKYDAARDRADNDVKTIYTASSLWTLLRMNDLERDERIVREIRPIARFLLSMQVKDGEQRGAFYYSRDAATGVRQERLVVGTASKTIFTLLQMYRRTHDRIYLVSAQRAGDWLVRRTAPDGRVFPVVRKSRDGVWKTFHGQSVLYSGQTLTALSRLYLVDPKPAYKLAADRIATRLLAQAEKSRYFIGDEFRRPNTVSTSWLAMAFLSYRQINPAPEYREAVYRATREILRHQIREKANPVAEGRYSDTKASSGNGWINEVMVEVYRQCLADIEQIKKTATTGAPRFHQTKSDIFLSTPQAPFDSAQTIRPTRVDLVQTKSDVAQAIPRTVRWLIQNIYADQNSRLLPNPARARGGSIRNSIEASVRTDAVCHTANSLIGFLDLLL